MAVARARRPGSGEADADRKLAELATGQHGVVASWQLRRLGLSANAIANRVKRGRLHPLHRSTYAVGHSVLGPEGRWMAATLAVGEDAVLSHASAAALWGLRPTHRRDIDVTTPRSAHGRAGIRVHRSRTLVPDEVTSLRGIPTTSVPRTLLDLAESDSRRVVEQALDGSEVLRVLDLATLQVVLDRHPKRPGAAVLGEVLAVHAIGTTITRSELEERFLALCRDADLPPPELNVAVTLEGGEVATVDALWRAARVVVETDGRAVHSTPERFERDRWRDAQLQRSGFAVIRLTWRRVVDEGPAVARTVGELLAARTPGNT